MRRSFSRFGTECRSDLARAVLRMARVKRLVGIPADTVLSAAY